MRRTNRITSLILSAGLILSMLLFLRVDVDAAYDYKVKFIIGGTGQENAKFISNPEALVLVSDTATAAISEDGKELIISGLQYDDEIIFDPKLGVGITPVTVTDEDGNEFSYTKYLVKGIRRSGADKWVAKSAFQVKNDETYVIAYGVGTIVSYKVNYLDAAGNELIPTATYYGLLGEEVYIPYRYVDGYVPNAYNIDVLFLEENQEFTFTYDKSQLPAGTTTYESSTRTEYSTVMGQPQYIYQTVPRQLPGQIAQTATNATAGAGAGNNDTADAGDNSDGVVIDDEETPLGVQDIVKIGERPVPRAIVGDRGYSRNFGFAIIVVIIGMVGLLISSFITIKDNKNK